MLYESKRVKRVALLLFIFMFAGVATTVFARNSGAARKPKRLLVVTVTKGFRHSSIPTAERVLQEISDKDRSFTVDYARTDDELRAKTTAQALANYDGVVFANTTTQGKGTEDLPLADRAAFLDWIKAGHAFVGIHAATDTFHHYPPFIEMIGGEFQTHGPQVTVQLVVDDPNHPATKMIPNRHTVHDEIYILKNFDRSKVHMLLSLDKNPNKKDATYDQPGYFPIAWGRMYGKGRVFYTALGHREDVLESDWFRAHLLGGIRWALGTAKGDAKPQTRMQSPVRQSQTK